MCQHLEDFSLIFNLTLPSASLEPFPLVLPVVTCQPEGTSQPDPLGLFIKSHRNKPKRAPAARASAWEQHCWADTAHSRQEQRQKCKEEVDERYQEGAAVREGNLPWMREFPGAGIPGGSGRTQAEAAAHSRQLPPEAARWLRNISAAAACTAHSPGTGFGSHKLGGLLSPWAAPEGWSIPTCSTRQGGAGCCFHLEKVERLCKSETRRGLAKPVVFWCSEYLNYTK